jgi:hypothetical protein
MKSWPLWPWKKVELFFALLKNICIFFSSFRYNALVDLLAKYEDEVQKLEKENKDFRLSVTDVDFTSINITKQESGQYTHIEYRRVVDEKDYFEGMCCY